jgi:hypothetical protein
MSQNDQVQVLGMLACRKVMLISVASAASTALSRLTDTAHPHAQTHAATSVADTRTCTAVMACLAHARVLTRGAHDGNTRGYQRG